MQTFNFDKGIVEIDNDTLKRTADYELAKGGLPNSRPIEHHAFIETVGNILADRTGMSVTPDSIIIPERHAARVMYKGDKALCPVENYLVQRVLTSLNISVGDDDYGLSVGINFNEKGIEVVYGTKVFVCSNLNIFGKYRIRTYGADKIDYTHTVSLLEHWADNYMSKFESDIRIIDNLKNQKINSEDYHQILGKLIKNAGLSVNNKSIDAPMNVTQTLRMIEESFNSSTNPLPQGFFEGNTEECSLWDMTQWGTAILKPNSNDVMSVYSHNHKFNDFMLKQGSLESMAIEL